MLRWPSRMLVCALLAGAVAVMAVGAPDAVAKAKWYGSGPVRATCHVNPAGLIYAHVYTRMWVNNTGHFSHWVTNFRLKARLIPTTSGLNYSRSWRTDRAPNSGNLLQNHRYNGPLAVNTDVMSPNADWQVDVKLIWDRKLPLSDIVKKKRFPLDPSGCAGSGQGLPAAPQLPSNNGAA